MRQKRTLEQQLAATELRAARLRTDISQSRRKLDARRKIIIGATVMEMMQDDDELRAKVTARLHENVTRPHDREAIAPWLSTT